MCFSPLSIVAALQGSADVVGERVHGRPTTCAIGLRTGLCGGQALLSRSRLYRNYDTVEVLLVSRNCTQALMYSLKRELVAVVSEALLKLTTRCNLLAVTPTVKKNHGDRDHKVSSGDPIWLRLSN